ncbi:MAG: HD domain-containing protein [Myxococcota bacterium]
MTLTIFHEAPTLDVLLEPHRATIGADFAGYRNHCLRVLSYALHFADEPSDADRQALEVALAFHDIALWTDRALAYLEPSEALATRENEARGLGVDPQLLRDLIHWHHKATPFRGPRADLVNALRKGDWVDATKGTFRKGLRRKDIRAVEAALPNEGFHDALQRLAGDNNEGKTLGGLWKVTAGILKW